jgi:hemoglobin
MAGTFGKCTAFANDSARGTHLLRVLSLHKQLPIAKERQPLDGNFSLRQQTRLFAGILLGRVKLRARYGEMFNYKINYFRNAGQNGDLLNLK